MRTKLLVLSLVFATYAFGQDGPEWKLEVKKQGGKIDTIRWIADGETPKTALSPNLLEVVRKDAAAYRAATARGISHSVIVVPEDMISTAPDGGVAILLPGKLVDSVTIDFAPERLHLHSDGFFYTYFDADSSQITLESYSISQGKSVPLKKNINRVHLKSGKAKIEFDQDAVSVTEEERVTRFAADGGRGRAIAKVRPVSESTKQFLEELKAEDLVEQAKSGALFAADWMEKYAEGIERRLMAEEGTKRLSLIVGHGNQSALINRLAQRIADGSAKSLQGWSLYKVNPALFGPDGLVGGETRKVNEWFEKLAGQKLIIVFENAEKLTLIGGDASSVDKKITGAMAPYLSSGKVLVLATTSREGLVRLQKDEEFLGVFETVNIPEPNPAEVLAIVTGRAKAIASRKDKVNFSPEALAALEFQARRHLPEEAHPTVEIEGMEAIALEKASEGESDVSADDIRKWVSAQSRRPSLAGDTLQKFSDPTVFYPGMTEVIGNPRALEAVRSLISQMAAQDRDPETAERKRQGLKIILLTGPSGTGKTFIPKELEKALAAQGIKWPLNIINGNEFNSERSDWKLLGPPGGFKDSEKEYLYDWAKQNPEGILFFDEFDKLHPNVSKVMMNILDEGVVPAGATNSTFRWRGIIFLAANFGAKGSDQDGYAGQEERALSDLVDQFTLYFTDDYTFQKPDLKKVKKFFVDGKGEVWPKPKDQKEKDVLIGKLGEVIKTEYGRIGRIIDNQLLGRIGVVEVLVHWTKAEYKQLIDRELARRIEKVKKDGKLQYTEAFKNWLLDTTWGQGGRLVFSQGARAFVDSREWNEMVKDRLATFAKVPENKGKTWEFNFADGKVDLYVVQAKEQAK